LAFGMVNARQRKFTGERIVARPLIGAEQANLCRNGFADELGKSARSPSE
jgi:hypothetical protein